MTETPQDQGPGDGRDAGRDPARDAAQGGSRRRTDAGYLGQAPSARSPRQEARETSYSESARYLDSAWQSSSGRPPTSTPYQGPTQVVPIQDIPSGPHAAGPQARPSGSHPTGPQPADPTVVVPLPGADAGAGVGPGTGGNAGAAPGRPEMDLGAYAMGGAQPNPGGPAGPAAGGGFGAGGSGGHGPYGGGDGGGHDGGPYGHPGDSGDDGSGGGRGKRRRALVIWGVAGAVALTGAGLVAAKTLSGDDKKSTTSVGLTTSPTPSPAAPSTPPPSTVPGPPSTSASDKASSSGRPSGSSSGSKSPSGSPSGTSTGSKSPNVDSDDDGIADDPGATDPAKLVGGARTAYQQAKQAMAADGVTMTLTSGKRSYEHQKDLFEKEVREKGSTAAARMRVLPPDESSHVDGNAIDINVAAQPWMKSKGKQFGWCQIYANEPWHFEFQASYKTAASCPALKPHP